VNVQKHPVVQVLSLLVKFVRQSSSAVEGTKMTVLLQYWHWYCLVKPVARILQQGGQQQQGGHIF